MLDRNARAAIRPFVIQDHEAEALLHALVAVPSPSHHEAAAARLLADWMAGHGYDEAFIDVAGNAVGIRGGRSAARTIVLLGHLDTFDGDLPVRIDGRTLYGRGTVDAKGPLAAFAVAGARAALPADLRLVTIGAVEEEARSSRGARFAATQYQPDFCLIGEPSGWDRITLGYKGRLLLHWHWHGPLAHSAGASVSPAERAVAYWLGVRAYADAFNEGCGRLFDRLDATLLDLNTGQDGAYGWARMTIGLRLPPGVEPEALAAALPPLDDAAVSADSMERAFLAEKDSALSRALRGAIRAEGGTPAFVCKTGTADMNVVGPIWACPIAAYGPGDSALDHTPEERIDLDEYLRAIRVLTCALERL